MPARVEITLVRELPEQREFGLIQLGRHDDLHHRDEIARATARLRQPAPGKPQLLRRRRTRRHLEAHGAGQRGYLDRGSQRRFPRRERQVQEKIVTRRPI
jgi:hypothetical protein